MPPTESAEIAIVGAGPSGLSAAGALQRRGHAPVVLEQDGRIGGRWAGRYERLHLHTVRRFSGLPHRGMPKDYPRYVHKDLFARYLQDYAEQFGLDVRLGEHVGKVRDDGRGWLVETDSAVWRARVVIIATGTYNERVLPPWPGMEAFRGRIVHSGEYHSGREFSGTRALVVGIGNSGAEIAADLVEQGAAFVAISVRTPPPIMPRDLFGVVPVQLLGLALTPVPAPRLLDRAGSVVRRIGTGDLRKYGLGKAEWGPLTARRPAVIDVGFLRQLKAGRIHVRPNVERFTPSGVVYAGGEEEDFDPVVAATGFATGLTDFLDVPDAVGHSGRPRFKSGRPTSFPGLYFLGFDETTRGVLFEANRDARRLARSIDEYLRKAAA
jgi:cation diffusion facilitator CzcD-associated flavoprotein CzcO